MKLENDKKLKWMDPCLRLLNRRKRALGLCISGATPDASAECTHGPVAANVCNDGGEVIGF